MSEENERPVSVEKIDQPDSEAKSGMAADRLQSAVGSASNFSQSGVYLSACLGRRFRSGNDIQLLDSGDEIFPAMLAAIDNAESHIEFQTFVYWGGAIARTFAEHLADAGKRGVRVRVLLDAFGSKSIDKEAALLLEQHCELCWFRPLAWFRFGKNLKRSHRKLLICDGDVGFTGGVGIGEQWTGDGCSAGNWRDIHFRLRGPILETLQATFLENWLEACPAEDYVQQFTSETSAYMDGQENILALPSTASDFWSPAGTMIYSAITAARHSLRITTPYFTTDKKLASLLRDAHNRGVEVQIILPDYEQSDSRLAALAALRSIQPLLGAGIQLYGFEPTFIHSKCILIDDEVAIVGSVNFNQRSQRKDDEFSLVIDRGEAVTALIETFLRDLSQCRQLKEKSFRKRYYLPAIFAQIIEPFRRHI